MAIGNLEGDAISFLSRHLIAMSCDYELLDANGQVVERKNAVYSGSFLEVHNRYFWLTAGHCMRDLEAALKTGRIKITEGSFVDSFGYAAQHMYSIPYTYEVGDALWFEISEQGIDYALLPLDYTKIKAFDANHVVPLNRMNWVHQHEETFESFRMLGIPRGEVHTQIHDTGRMETHVRPLMVAVDPIDINEIGELPDGQEPPSEMWFTGRLHAESKVADIVGMSGGPIFGFYRNDEGELFYNVVAIQSRWWPKRRIIFGCSLAYFAEQAYQQLGSAIEQMQAGN